MDEHVGRAYARVALERELAEPDSSFFLATVGEQAAGFIKLNRERAQTERQPFSSVEVEQIYLLREFQGLGLGRRLMEKAFDAARDDGLEYVWLGVWERNPSAIGFYEHAGFSRFGSHPFRFGSVEHTDVLMRKPTCA
jgi:ribosomal protein S18 acetylase RimI-like enzyme